MIFEVILQKKAQEDLIRLYRDEPKVFTKVQGFIEELKQHPRTGTGHPEPLKGDQAGAWSRRITKKHRLVYEIHDTKVVVLVLTAYGHYDDK